jgi:hypothetical protein
MRNLVIGLAIVAFAFLGFNQLGQTQEQSKTPPEKKKDVPKPDKKAVKELMERKLVHSQKLLAALVKNELDKAATESEELLKIRKEAGWLIVKTETYDMWSKEFARSTEQIVKAAKDKNLDAAKLHYLELTMTCFNCHTYVRDLGDISFKGLEQ